MTLERERQAWQRWLEEPRLEAQEGQIALVRTAHFGAVCERCYSELGQPEASGCSFAELFRVRGIFGTCARCGASSVEAPTDGPPGGEVHHFSSVGGRSSARARVRPSSHSESEGQPEKGYHWDLSHRLH
jgi:hypothetical protein